MNYKFRLNKFLPFIALTGLTACSGNLDFDFRDQFSGLLDTSFAAQGAVANRPDPDARGVITFQTYQVVMAKNGDRIGDVAQRVSTDADFLGRYNGISQEAILRHGEIIALPPNITTTGAAFVPTVVEISELLDRSPGAEPTRHKVTEGETAFSIARLYNVTVEDLIKWNELSRQKELRTGQFLLIPKPLKTSATVSLPGQGSLTPNPPSSTRAQPATDLRPNVSTQPATPITDLGSQTKASKTDTRFLRPTFGNIIRSYKKGDNEGIDIGVKAGTDVVAADDGTVAAVTKDTNGVPILILKHIDGLLTVYANVDGLSVQKGDQVKRGQKVAKVRDGTPSFLHFEVRKGLESVDPDDYI
jgi:LysM repeat protein